MCLAGFFGGFRQSVFANMRGASVEEAIGSREVWGGADF